MARWEIDLDQWYDEIEEEIAADFREISLELLGRLIVLTPVDTGRLRSAWLFSINEISTAEENDSHDVAVLSRATLDSKIILQNNVEYGPYVNDGTEHMAGRFFVEGAIGSIQE